MKPTKWSLTRFQRLFARYNRLYWRGRLSQYNLAVAPHAEMGLHDQSKRLITINVSIHRDDAEVRATLLHEMAHAADQGPGRDHGYGFWRQVEALLRKGAPVEVGPGELPGQRFVVEAIPRMFPLSRAAARRYARRREREIPKNAPTQILDEDYIIGQFADAANDSSSWNAVRQGRGTECGLLDVEGKPRDQRSRNILRKARVAFLQQLIVKRQARKASRASLPT